MEASARKTGGVPFLSLVTSEMHFWTSLPQKNEPRIFEALDRREGADMMDRYNVSRLLEILVFRHLTRKVIADRLRTSAQEHVAWRCFGQGQRNA